MDVDTYITMLEDRVSGLYSGKEDPDQGQIETMMREVNATIAEEAIRIAMNGKPDEVAAEPELGNSLGTVDAAKFPNGEYVKNGKKFYVKDGEAFELE